jgi:Leucine-rich repeat (LRR) protein
LSENELSSFASFSGHNNIVYLEIKKNKLKSCQGISQMARLQELYLNENEITHLADLVGLPALKVLSVNTNKLESLSNLPDLPALEKFDLGSNPIEKLAEVKKLGGLDALSRVIFQGCPFADEKGDDLKKEVLIALSHLKIKMVNEDEITEEDIQAAKDEKEERAKA